MNIRNSKGRTVFLLIVAAVLPILASAQSEYDGQCVTCTMHSDKYYWCTHNKNCEASSQNLPTCYQTIKTCLSYEAVDLGNKEIVLDSTTGKGTTGKETMELSNGASLVISITNSYEKDAWISFAGSLYTQYLLFYTYQPNDLSSLTDYTYTSTGKTWIEQGKTMNFFAGANGGSVKVNIEYGAQDSFAWMGMTNGLLILVAGCIMIAF